MIDLEKRLNPAQYAAVTAIDGPVLVIAGAGSGKTRVIEYRVLHLVRNNINPNSILLLTFTRRAARQMLERAAKHDVRCRDVEGGTFHSFCYAILKKYATALGFTRSFLILDEADSEESVHKCCTRLGFFDKEKRFPKKDTLKDIISMSINKKMNIKEVLKRSYPHFLDYAKDIEKLRQTYQEYKIEKNYLDYDDLLVYLRILLEKEQIRKKLTKQYRYIMVDEYQDTNALQGEITYLLGQEHRNVMVVGDDAQSIYGFRGATHENIMQFPRQFSDCKIIKLEDNYRSSQSILDVSNSIMENMKNKYSKCLVSARKVAGDKPGLMFFKDAYEEAEWIAAKIKAARDEGLDFEHQAVLFRSSYISIALQAQLSKINIPYQVFGGVKFYETAHVKDVLAHLKVLVNPKDELSWNRLLMLIEGIGPRTAERITDEILRSCSFDTILKKVFAQYEKGHKYAQDLGRLKIALKKTQGKDMVVGERFEIILDYYQPLLQSKFDDWHIRVNDLETLRQISMRYSSLDKLLADFAIESPERGVSKVYPEMPERERLLTLSTIHSAKGLEWDNVFLVGLMDGVLPVSFALSCDDEVEEEHRLFYVGITRAKNRLFLCFHHEGTRGGITQFNKISRFVDVPNVLAKLEQKGAAQEVLVEAVDYDEFDATEAIYDKKRLYRRVVDYLTKDEICWD